MEPKPIDSLSLLRAYLHHRMKDYDGFGEMYDVFISGEAPKRFLIYPMTSESGETELWIDYSLSSGGGWLNVGMPFDKFVESIESMIAVWPMTDEITDVLVQELYLLKEFVEKRETL